jgi:hypothetical protein
MHCDPDRQVGFSVSYELYQCFTRSHPLSYTCHLSDSGYLAAGPDSPGRSTLRQTSASSGRTHEYKARQAVALDDDQTNPPHPASSLRRGRSRWIIKAIYLWLLAGLVLALLCWAWHLVNGKHHYSERWHRRGARRRSRHRPSQRRRGH